MGEPFHQVLASALAEQGVEVMFGVMGDANMFIADSFHRLPEGRFVSSAHEGGGVQMAAGYAAVTGRVGVATVTHGAIANTVSALFDCVRGRYPVVVIAGDTARNRADHLQNIPQRDVVVPTGATYLEVGSAASVARDVASALRLAHTEHTAVVLGVSADLQNAECVPDPAPRVPVGAADLVPTAEVLEEAAGMLLSASRPLVVGGRGVLAGEPEAAVQRLAHRIGAPLATSLRGKGLFNDDPCHLGIFGTLANPLVSEAIGISDCVIAFGASLSPLTTLRGELLEGKRVIQVDVDPVRIGRLYPVDLGVVGDARLVADGLTGLVDLAEATASAHRAEELGRRAAAWAEADRRVDESQPLDITGVLHRMNALVPAERTLCIDGGRFSHEALRIMSVPEPRCYAHCLNVGHIGMSVGYGIGAAIGEPTRQCLVVAGDGGFMLGGLSEFVTAVRHEARLVVCLLNDSAYGAEYYRFVAQGLAPELTTFQWPGFAEVAAAVGGRGVRVESWADFAPVERELASGGGPLLVEIVLDRDAIPDPGDH